MKRNPKMVRCRIARLNVDGMQYCIYVGPEDKIPHGWSICYRRVINPGGLAA
jgi:hypothetical protein